MAIKTTQKSKLKFPPLLEAIFEIRWEMEQEAQSGRMRDPTYPLMYGRLCEQMKGEFPTIEDLPSVQAHPESAPFVPRHRVRSGKNGYPLFQIGPGILTVNHAKEYAWGELKQPILRLVDQMMKISPLKLFKAEIRYVNAIPYDPAGESLLPFLEKKLHTKVQIDAEPFASHPVKGMGLNLGYDIDDPKGHLLVAMNLGQIEERPSLIFQTVIQSFGVDTPKNGSEMGPWLDGAHEVAGKAFQSLCRGSLMQVFQGGIA